MHGSEWLFAALHGSLAGLPSRKIDESWYEEANIPIEERIPHIKELI